MSSSIPSSTSSSSAEPAISVVIGSNAPQAVPACLDALAPQRDGVEVLVYEGRPSPAEVRARYPWARFVDRPGALVPELWRDGIDESRSGIVALTIAQMVAAPDWLAAMRSAHDSYDAVGGAIEPGQGLRLVDWAEYFCRYARDMLPFTGRHTIDLPGDNAAYKRDVLDRTADLYRDGFWEPVVHRRLAKEGMTLWQDPAVLVCQGRSTGWGAFASQRLHHGRAYGRQRGGGFTRVRALVGIVAAAAVPFLMTFRVLQLVFRKGRHRRKALAATPLILSFNVVWAAAEARGYVDVLGRR